MDKDNVSELDKIKLEITLPAEMVLKIDNIIRILDFQSREGFVITAVRRLVDHYYPLILGGSESNPYVRKIKNIDKLYR